MQHGNKCHQHSRRGPPPRQANGSGKRQPCYVCPSEGHQAKDCPRTVKSAAHNPEKRARTQKVSAVEPETDEGHSEDDESSALVARVNSPLSSGEVRKSKLQEIELECAGTPIVAILDTGSEVTIVKESLVPDAAQEPSGKIKLVSAFGETVEAKLVALSFSLRQTAFVNAPDVVQIVCAITDKLTDADCLLSKEDWELLTDMRSSHGEPAFGEADVNKNEACASVGIPKPKQPGVRGEAPGESCARVNETRSQETPVAAPPASDEEAAEAADGADTDEVPSQRTKLRTAQLADESLKKAWADATAGKAGMFVSDGLLYH